MIYTSYSRLNILIIEDDWDDYSLTEEMIRAIPESKEWTVEWCYNYNEAIEEIRSKKYHLYFVDYFLGAKTGLDLLRESIELGCNDPIILFTSKGSRDIDMEAMKTGAMDYLEKGELTTEKLERSIRYALGKSETMKALRVNERKYRNIFEQSKDALFLTTQSFSFVTVNHATSLMLGYTLEEFADMSFLDLVADDKNAELIDEVFATKGEVNDVEVELVCKSGDEIICLFSAIILSDDEPEKLVQCILHDITLLKRAEKAALFYEKQAATGRLAQVLAHEIRNPLTNINLSVEKLKYPDIADREKYFEIIFRNSQRINQIISQLLFFSGGTEVLQRPLIVQELINGVITNATDRLTLKTIRLQTNLPHTPIRIMADRSKLTMALLNIINNAIEAMDKETKILVISVKKDRDGCEIRITDNGHGMTEEQQRRLFEPYFTTKKEGIGLGLPTALSILNSHQAKVDVISLKDTGTTFSIFFKTLDAVPA
ncbi:hybrid sensor histidine kinase/response regulator [Flavihumibacter solisilvae]|uniref:histidine kinase n=1 Tax=Flavihumibacter solisilvae TaxID=1349421 RepID=A0A0C1LED9_9BACT|nr:hybrid sensor histidine kinase/response regulator [Flavihumibacter solisilvae]KIC93793.1 hypothetical protein OI18_15630 [Flavihumibacter solisilvae]